MHVVSQELAPLMAVEHSIGHGPLGDDPYAAAVPIINRSDTYRTYDVTPELSIPTTLERSAGLLAAFDAVRERSMIILYLMYYHIQCSAAIHPCLWVLS
jgi:hypothetical protein